MKKNVKQISLCSSRFLFPARPLGFGLRAAVLTLALGYGQSSLAAPSPGNESDSRSSANSGRSAETVLEQLPLPRDAEEQRFVTNQNLHDYLDYILAPVAEWIREGRFFMRVVRHLDSEWYFSDADRKSSEENSRQCRLTPQRFVKCGDGGFPEHGLPFGVDPAGFRDGDSKARADKILWNTVAATMAGRDVLHNFDFAWHTREWSDGAIQRTATGLHYLQAFGTGVLPSLACVAGSEKSPACLEEIARATAPPIVGGWLRRDLLQLVAPPVVFGLANVSWRSTGVEPDRVWIYSPVVGRAREVFSSNRGDGLLGSAFSLDDLQVWSGNLLSMQADLLAEKTLLVAFPSLKPVPLEREMVSSPRTVEPAAVQASSAQASSAQASSARASSGQSSAGESSAAMEADSSAASSALPMAVAYPTAQEQVLSVRGTVKRLDGSTTTVLWNGDTKQYPQYSSWVPISVKWVPRKVWIIELSSLDPFHVTGRQVLAIDQATFLPMFKLTYARSGAFQKMVIGGWMLATQGRDVAVPLQSFLLGVDGEMRRIVATTTHDVRILDREHSGYVRHLSRLLDIREHGRKAKEPASSSSSSASSASSAAGKPKSAKGSTSSSSSTKKKGKSPAAPVRESSASAADEVPSEKPPTEKAAPPVADIVAPTEAVPEEGFDE